ncbi:hypothetical protein N7478_005775 [Penicillium angulare]|uniref:uncharacterized protein n=1 Tax=Penicillium angulare TaxID=116970 RepID=UPI00253F82C2|nr:uncharacterized protein N7478_005775 [Penicillium angulare]KAJ5280403.1 hypothetical protein N7478_005775 [Penicillium angulare]
MELPQNPRTRFVTNPDFPFGTLPADIFYLITRNLDSRSLGQLSETCKSLHNLLEFERRVRATDEILAPAELYQNRFTYKQGQAPGIDLPVSQHNINPFGYMSGRPRGRLFDCIQWDRFHGLNVLFNLGADANSYNLGGIRALHFAISYQSLEAVKMLIVKGADVNARDIDVIPTRAPLDNATQPYRASSIVQVLTSVGAELTEEIMNRIIAARDTATLQFAVNQVPDNVAFQWGVSMLFAIASTNDCTMFDILEPHIARGQFINSVRSDTYGSALHVAVQRKDKSVLAWPLIRLGINMDQIAVNGRTPLHEALANGHSDIALRMIQSGIAVDIADRDGHTELGLAIMIESLEVVRALLDRGADVNFRSNPALAFSWSPLHSAIRTKDIEIVDAILHRGSERPDFDFRENGLTALEFAKWLQLRDIWTLMAMSLAERMGVPWSRDFTWDSVFV